MVGRCDPQMETWPLSMQQKAMEDEHRALRDSTVSTSFSMQHTVPLLWNFAGSYDFSWQLLKNTHKAL